MMPQCSMYGRPSLLFLQGFIAEAGLDNTNFTLVFENVYSRPRIPTAEGRFRA